MSGLNDGVIEMPGLYLHPDGGLRELAHDVFDTLADDFSRPSFRAGFTVSLLTAALLARAGVRALPAIVLSVMLGASVERGFEMAERVAAALAGDAAGEV